MDVANLVPGARRRLTAAIYDTLTLAKTVATGAEKVFFGNTASANGIAVTNMVEPYRLPPEQVFTVRSIRIVPIGCTDTDLVALAKAMVFKLVRSGSNIEEACGGIEYFPGGAGFPGVVTTTGVMSVSNGLPDPRAINILEEPITLSGSDHFRGLLVGTGCTPTSDMVLRVYLDGTWEKGL